MKLLDKFLEKLEKKYKNIEEISNKEIEELEKDIRSFYKKNFEKLDKDKIRNLFFHYSRSINDYIKFSFYVKIVQTIQLLRPETYPIPVVENLENESFLITVSHPIFELIIIEKELIPIFPISELYILEDELVEELAEKIFLKDTIIKNGIFYQSNVIFRTIDYIFNKILYFYPKEASEEILIKENKDFKVNENQISNIYNYIFEALTDVFIDKRLKDIKVETKFENIVIDTLKDLSEINFIIKTAQLENMLITMFEEEEREIFEIEQKNSEAVYNLIYFFGLENINFYLLSIYFDYDIILDNVNKIVQELKNNENLKEDLEIFITNIIDLPYISKGYKNRDLLYKIVKSVGFSKDFEEEIILNTYFRSFQYDEFLKNFKNNKDFYLDTLIQYELSKLFTKKQDKKKTAEKIENIFNQYREDILSDYKKYAVKFLIYYLKEQLNNIDKEKDTFLYIMKEFYNEKALKDIKKSIPENLLIETTLEEVIQEIKKSFIDLISFYPYEENFYNKVKFEFDYKLPSY